MAHYRTALTFVGLALLTACAPSPSAAPGDEAAIAEAPPTLTLAAPPTEVSPTQAPPTLEPTVPPTLEPTVPPTSAPTGTATATPSATPLPSATRLPAATAAPASATATPARSVPVTVAIGDITPQPTTTGGGIVVPPPGIPNPRVFMAARASEALATRLGIDISDVTLVEASEVAWPDTSLGCPAPGEAYQRVVTTGFQIVLEAHGQRYTYHTDRVGRVVLCVGGAPG